MLAVFATLAFLTAMWLCVTLVAGTVEQSGLKIIAALKGQATLASPTIAPVQLRVSQRYPSVTQRPVRVLAGLRAAA